MKEYNLPSISILFLDFNKPEESKLALESIHKNAKFDYKLIYLSNGGDQDYVLDFYKNGLINNLILNKQNNGLGYGTEDLFRFCETEFAIYWQNDQIMGREVTQEEINYYINTLKNNLKVGAISLAGLPCGNNTYSERASIINTKFYNSIPKTHGGCGPFNHLKYNEQAIQEFFKENNYLFLPISNNIVIDNGKYTIRELPCGGLVRMRTDKKSVTWLKLPKEPYFFPDMTKEEWENSIDGKWENGVIPIKYLKDSFNCWGNIEN